MSEPEITVEEMVEKLDGMISGTIGIVIDVEFFEFLQAIRSHLMESDIAHWMDRCHELEAELAEVRRRTSDKEGE